METQKQHKPLISAPEPPPPPPPELPPSSPPPPSLNSSPSHEFSFTISLHPPTPLSSNTTATSLKHKEPASPLLDFDLSPADDIFFHGHLLPLHFLSHRASNASIETEHNLCKITENKPTANRVIDAASSNHEEFKERTKAKPFSTFFALRKWLRGSEDKEAEKQRKKKTKVFGRLWKKYASLIEPFLFFKLMKEKRELRRNPYSFSRDCNPREGGWRRRWRGDFSAPASMRTSPANSGLLVAPSSTFSSSDESTMEELQNAIQAAIAHCKSSVAVKENKCG